MGCGGGGGGGGGRLVRGAAGLLLRRSAGRASSSSSYLSSSFSSVAAVAEAAAGREEEEEERSSSSSLAAWVREGAGSAAVRKLKRSGRFVPGVVFGQRQEDILVAVHRNEIVRRVQQQGRYVFLSRLLDLHISEGGPDGPLVGPPVRVLPRLLHINTVTDEPINITFLRCPPESFVKIYVPVNFVGEDTCPGIRKGGFLNTIKRAVPYMCPGHTIPEFVEVDLSKMEKGDVVLHKDLVVPEVCKLAVKYPDLPVCKIGGKGLKGGDQPAAA